MEVPTMNLELAAGLVGFLGVITTAIVAYRNGSPAARHLTRAMRALDIAADYRRLLRDMGVEDSEIKKEYEEIEIRYQELLHDYQNGSAKI
jgi:hypothetical protein